MNGRKRRCKVDVFYNAVAFVSDACVDTDFSVWFGTLSVACSPQQGEKLLERETLIGFENGEGGSAKLFPKRDPLDADDSRGGEVCEFYFVGTSPLLDLRGSGERRLLA